MKLKCSLIVLAAFLLAHPANANQAGTNPTDISHAEASPSERYSLPPSKYYYGTCRQAALLQHPGIIRQQRLLHPHGDEYLMRYEIQTNDGPEWLVLCDLANGSIIRGQRLIDENF